MAKLFVTELSNQYLPRSGLVLQLAIISTKIVGIAVNNGQEEP
jgi:hypothetical protein